MSRDEELEEQLLRDQSEASDRQESWLEIGKEVEVIATNADGAPYRLVGRFEGVRVPNGGGPIRLVVKDGNEEISVDPGEIGGVTKQG
jgi:hypothetical protein